MRVRPQVSACGCPSYRYMTDGIASSCASSHKKAAAHIGVRIGKGPKSIQAIFVYPQDAVSEDGLKTYCAK